MHATHKFRGKTPLRVLAILTLTVVISSCKWGEKVTKPEIDSPPVSKPKPQLQFNLPKAYPIPLPTEQGLIPRDDLERAYIEGAEAYESCMIELTSVKKQAEACLNEPN